MVRANIIRQYYEGLKLSFFFMHNDSPLQFIFARFVKEVKKFFSWCFTSTEATYGLLETGDRG